MTLFFHFFFTGLPWFCFFAIKAPRVEKVNANMLKRVLRGVMLGIRIRV